MKAHKISREKLPIRKLKSTDIGNGSGVFILYRSSMGAPAYIGRADKRLYDRIAAYRHHSSYRYVKVMRCDDPKDAFQWHCIFWHKGQSTIDNSAENGGAHPELPHGVDAICPMPGCKHVFSAPAVEHAHAEEF